MKFYLVQIKFKLADDAKYVKEWHLIETDNVSNAEDTVINTIGAGLDDFHVLVVKESNIISVRRFHDN